MQRKRRILILCEGFEEKPYIDKIISFNKYNKDLYEFDETINLKGSGEIIARYQSKYSLNHYDLILVFCDADKGSSQFIKIRKDFNNTIFGGKDIAKEVFIFVNPVTMQVILSHLSNIKLTSISKKINSPIIEKYTMIKRYDAKEEQIKELIKLIKFSNYNTMKDNLSEISQDFNKIPNTNFLKFVKRFESNDPTWIEDINKKIYS